MRARSSRYSSSSALALVVVGKRREVDVPGQPIHHERVRIVAQAVRVRDRHAVRLEQVVGRHLVGDPVRHHDPGFSLPPCVERQHPTAHLDVDVPRRPPAREAGHADDPPSDRALDPRAPSRVVLSFLHESI